MPNLNFHLEKGLPLEDAKRRVADDVFGVGHRVDRHGRPIEQGVGSPGHETQQHFDAVEKYSGKDAADLARAKAAKNRG